MVSTILIKRYHRPDRCGWPAKKGCLQGKAENTIKDLSSQHKGKPGKYDGHEGHV